MSSGGKQHNIIEAPQCVMPVEFILTSNLSSGKRKRNSDTAQHGKIPIINVDLERRDAKTQHQPGKVRNKARGKEATDRYFFPTSETIYEFNEKSQQRVRNPVCGALELSYVSQSSRKIIEIHALLMKIG